MPDEWKHSFGPGASLRVVARDHAASATLQNHLQECVLMKRLSKGRRLPFVMRAALIAVLASVVLDILLTVCDVRADPTAKLALVFITTLVFFTLFRQWVTGSIQLADADDHSVRDKEAQAEIASTASAPMSSSDARNQSRGASVLQPIHSSLPLDEDDEYKEIVADFIARLDVRLIGMLAMAEDANFSSLADEAHWLKGSGGTVGFGDLTEPATALMNASRAEDLDVCEQMLADLLEIRQRMVIPALQNFGASHPQVDGKFADESEIPSAPDPGFPPDPGQIS